MHVLIGCGGWDYFKVPGSDPLQAYAQAYDFVEANSTFYHTPAVPTVKAWRTAVPDKFEFTVKCSKELTHDIGLMPTLRAYEVFEAQKTVCKELNSSMLVLQTPPQFDTPASDVRDFFRGIKTNDVKLVWDIRGKKRPEYSNMARDLGITESFDLSMEDAPMDQDLLYARIFGPDAKRELTSKHLKTINDKVRSSGAKKVYLTFHGSRMYKDAAGLITYRKKA
jgi:uncharacterized protein YecE (DUF72 family)